MSYSGYNHSNFGGDDEESLHDDQETEFGMRTFKQTARKNEKKTFWCTLCSVELNSIETRQSHDEGRKHRERVSAEAYRRGVPEYEVDEYAIEQISNPESIKKKTIERLAIKIRKVNDPVVGLKFIEEFMPESNDEMEPYYKCIICNKQGEGNAMLNHVVGREHRINFFKEKGNLNSENLPSKVLKAMAEDNFENDQCHRIVTFVSDLKYPWPAGKAPWAIEQGGDGVHPDMQNQDQRKFVTPIPDFNEAIPTINPRNAEPTLDYVFEVANKLSAKIRSLKDPDAQEDMERALFYMESVANIIKAKIKKEEPVVKTEVAQKERVKVEDMS